MEQLERDIEAKFGEQLSKWAYENHIEVVYLKLVVPGQRGWPDRLILWQGGGLMFIEWKRAGEHARKLQKYIHTILARCGFEVRVYDDWRLALREVTETIRSTATPSEGAPAPNGAAISPSIPEARKGKDRNRTKGV